MFRTSELHAAYTRIVVQPLVNALLRLGIGAYLMSVIAAASAVAACAALAFDSLWGGFLIILSGYLDTLDGQMARTAGQAGPAGAFLDSMLDRYSDFLFVFGFLLHDYRADALDFIGVLILLWLAFGILMGNYAQARAEGLQETCSVGFWERPETILFLGLAGILNGLIGWVSEFPLFRPGVILGLSLLVLAVGTNWMALRRLFYGFNRMRRKHTAGFGPLPESSIHPASADSHTPEKPE